MVNGNSRLIMETLRLYRAELATFALVELLDDMNGILAALKPRQALGQAGNGCPGLPFIKTPSILAGEVICVVFKNFKVTVVMNQPYVDRVANGNPSGGFLV